jgi:dihydrofolate reductase
MGKVINSTFVSVDGVINHMPAWHFDYVDAEHDRIAEEQLRAADVLLMGRRTYEIYAGAWPQRTGPYADKINSMRKYVASTTLRTADWANTQVIADDLVETVAKLRAEPGDVLIHGFGPVSHTLINHGLLDELHLWVNPRFAGVGTLDDTLLRQGTNTPLEFLGARPLQSGVVLLSYRPRGADQTG